MGVMNKLELDYRQTLIALRTLNHYLEFNEQKESEEYKNALELKTKIEAFLDGTV